jgi:hypothetical protein
VLCGLDAADRDPRGREEEREREDARPNESKPEVGDAKGGHSEHQYKRRAAAIALGDVSACARCFMGHRWGRTRGAGPGAPGRFGEDQKKKYLLILKINGGSRNLDSSDNRLLKRFPGHWDRCAPLFAADNGYAAGYVPQPVAPHRLFPCLVGILSVPPRSSGFASSSFQLAALCSTGRRPLRASPASTRRHPRGSVRKAVTGISPSSEDRLTTRVLAIQEPRPTPVGLGPVRRPRLYFSASARSTPTRAPTI